MAAQPREADPDALVAVQAALARHEWQEAHDRARTAAFDDKELEAERSDLLAEALWWLGRLDDCITERETAYRLFDELGLHRRAGQCAVWLSEHHGMRLRPAIGSGWLRRARRALDGDRECAEYGALLLREAETVHGTGDLVRALALVDDALELGRMLRSANLEAEALQARGRILIDQGEVAEGLGHLDEAMLFAVEGRLGPYATGKVYCSLIGACEQLGDFDRAAEWTEATLQWSEQHPFAIFPGICRVHRAIVLKRRGALAEAEQEAARASQELLGSTAAISVAAFAEVGDIRRRLGQLDRAEEAFERALELCGRPCSELALLRLAQGRVEAARTIVGDCLRESSPNRLGRAYLLPTFIHVAIAAGELGEATEALAELEEIADDFDTATLRATATTTRGRLQLARGEEAAVSTLRDALSRWEALDVPYEIATVRTLLGQALRTAGDEEGAVQSFSFAAKLFDQIGARLDAEMVFGRSKPSLPAGLTEREVDVLRLIAAGKTNNEVAQELYLSAKTVSRHLSNIFTKIGVTSRAGATAFAFEQGLIETRR